MIGSLGMAGSLFSYEAMEGSQANIVSKVVAIDGGKEQIEQLLDQTRDEVRAMLNGHRHIVEGLRDTLLERNELIGTEITDAILAADGGELGRSAPGEPGMADQSPSPGRPLISPQDGSQLA
jgi:hypothetical protein